MGIMTWNESMKVGIKTSDQQHIKVFDLINQLYDAMKVGKTKNVLGEILVELAGYTKEHFGMEEKLFEKYGYPDAKVHMLQHAYLMRKTNELKAKFDDGIRFCPLKC